MDSHQLIIRPLRTEKSHRDSEQHNAYHFAVQPKATKGQIRHAIEELFPECKVTDVRTLHVRGKRRRVRYDTGFTRSWKKAIVSLRDGDVIDFGY